MRGSPAPVGQCTHSLGVNTDSWAAAEVLADWSGAMRRTPEEWGQGHLRKRYEDTPMGIGVKCGGLYNTHECQQRSTTKKALNNQGHRMMWPVIQLVLATNTHFSQHWNNDCVKEYPWWQFHGMEARHGSGSMNPNSPDLATTALLPHVESPNGD